MTTTGRWLLTFVTIFGLSLNLLHASEKETAFQVDSEYMQWKFNKMAKELFKLPETKTTEADLDAIFKGQKVSKSSVVEVAPQEMTVTEMGLDVGECNRKDADYNNCVSASLGTEAFLWEENHIRENAGAERQTRAVFNLKVKGIKRFTTKKGNLKEVEVFVDIVPKSMVVDTNETINGNNINAYWNNNSALLRPYLLGGISIGYDLEGDWTNRFNAGILKTHGMDNWAFTNHYAWGSRAARSGYNGAFENETKWGDVLTLRCGVNNGEWRSGDNDAFRTSGDRANSQPAAHCNTHVSLSRFLGRVGPSFIKNLVSENRSVFVGATANHGTSGSLNAATRTGQKEVQHDQVIYAGVWQRIGDRKLKLRIYEAKYERDTGTGCGNNCTPATIEGRGVEMRLDRVLSFGKYNLDFYATKWDLKSDFKGGDPEFFPKSPFREDLGTATSAEGWAAGIRMNPSDRYAISLNLKSEEFDNPLPIINGKGEKPGFQDDISVNLVVTGRFGFKSRN